MRVLFLLSIAVHVCVMFFIIFILFKLTDTEPEPFLLVSSYIDLWSGCLFNKTKSKCHCHESTEELHGLSTAPALWPCVSCSRSTHCTAQPALLTYGFLRPSSSLHWVRACMQDSTIMWLAFQEGTVAVWVVQNAQWSCQSGWARSNTARVWQGPDESRSYRWRPVNQGGSWRLG